MDSCEAARRSLSHESSQPRDLTFTLSPESPPILKASFPQEISKSPGIRKTHSSVTLLKNKRERFISARRDGAGLPFSQRIQKENTIPEEDT